MIGDAGEHREHQARVRRLAAALRKRPLPVGTPFPCPYLPGRDARQVALIPEPVNPGLYHALMDLNFRRLGPLFYRPACRGCSECRMIRVRSAAFAATRAQRRCQARNADVALRLAPPRLDSAREELYRRYLAVRHDGQMEGTREELERFLYTSPLRTLEFSYWLGPRLVGVGIADLEPLALSAVYCYFEPDLPRRSLGVLNVLCLIEEARRRGLPHVYLGYYVAGSPRMSYKAGYRPCEIRGDDGVWRAAGGEDA